MSLQSQLNQHQTRAVNAPGHSTILACPGSGKTRVLVERAVRLLSEHSTGRLCAVTFTRDAASELKARILSAVGDHAKKRFAVGTFHSIALSQIKRLKNLPVTRLLSEGERLALLRRCISQCKCVSPFADVVSAIDGAKSRLSLPSFTDPLIEDVMNAYHDLLASERSMDFADILLTATMKIKSGDMPPLSVRWLLVDEAQDMDEMQAEWVIEHGKSGIEVTIVGDDDQSLYAFRSALGHEGMMRVTDVLASQEITLPVNYRCAPNILAHAASLIAHNRKRTHKLIQAAREGRGVVSVHRTADRFDEAELIVKAIRESGTPSEWAVLARTNALLEPIEASLIQGNLPCICPDGKSVWNGIAGSTLTGLLKSLHHDGWTGMANALSICGIGAGLLNMRLERKNCGNMLNLLLDVMPQEEKSGRRTIESLMRGRAEWLVQLASGNVSLAVYAASSWLTSHCKGNRAPLIARLADIVAGMRGSLAQRLNAVTRQSSMGAGGVSLMTLHGSKGLEFGNVWILGVEDGILPHPDSTEEDERRLLYVGITRARNRLELSSAMEEGEVSRFLGEAGFFG